MKMLLNLIFICSSTVALAQARPVTPVRECGVYQATGRLVGGQGRTVLVVSSDKVSHEEFILLGLKDKIRYWGSDVKAVFYVPRRFGPDDIPYVFAQSLESDTEHTEPMLALTRLERCGQKKFLKIPKHPKTQK
jgi:hypothetical protein